MQFKEVLGVKVDTRIPDSVMGRIYQGWQEWIDGKIGSELNFAEPTNLNTRYEHIISGSGVGFTPDPFKPLKAIAKNADRKEVRLWRRHHFPPGKRYKAYMAYSYNLVNLKELTGLQPWTCRIIAEYPEIDDNCRVMIPKIVGLEDDDSVEIKLDDRIIAQLKFVTHKDLRLSGYVIREIFDFENYRIELVSSPESLK